MVVRWHFTLFLLISFMAFAPLIAGGNGDKQAAADAVFIAAHDDALRRAQVWVRPDTPVERASLRKNPDGPDSIDARKTISCRFRPGTVATR